MSWRSKITVNMHLFRGNKIAQMKKVVFKDFQAPLLEFKYFQVLDFATFVFKFFQGFQAPVRTLYRGTPIDVSYQKQELPVAAMFVYGSG